MLNLCLRFGKTQFSIQNGVKGSFQKQLVFFEQTLCKILYLFIKNLAKENIQDKMKFYSFSRFDPKRIFQQDVLNIWQKEVFDAKKVKRSF